MEKRWTLKTPDPGKLASLKKSLGIQEILCHLLINRGIETFEKARDFFRPELTMLHDPFLMKDMEKAVGRIRQAINQNEKILVFGDYDVDGTTAVSCMYGFLQKLIPPGNIEFYIPHRYREGYGISRQGIDFAAEGGFTLIIALDCGIKSAELIQYAGSIGIDFIVCDHHLPGTEIPRAAAILNPKQADCPYPYKDLCGCGIGLKLMQAMALTLNLPDESWHGFLDLTATAIAADIVPMTGENRILTYYGLKKINSNPSQGIAALIRKAGLSGSLDITKVVFMIAPRVNAAGRMDDARKAVQLFIEKDPARADALAAMLHADNDDRREEDLSITQEALEMIRNNNEWLKNKSSVVFKEGWHKGVVGIVASRLIEHYHRPTVVLTKSGDLVTGSARSIPGFNLYEAIYSCRDQLVAYGGHFAAAGLSMRPEKVDAFRNKFEEVVSATIEERLLIPEIILDAEISFTQINGKLFQIISQMEPFGPDNMQPVFMARGAVNAGYSKIVKEKHIRFHLMQDGVRINGIGFNLAGKYPLLEMNRPVDIAFKLEENEFNGNTSLQLKVLDIRLSE